MVAIHHMRAGRGQEFLTFYGTGSGRGQPVATSNPQIREKKKQMHQTALATAIERTRAKKKIHERYQTRSLDEMRAETYRRKVLVLSSLEHERKEAKGHVLPFTFVLNISIFALSPRLSLGPLAESRPILGQRRPRPSALST